MQSKSVRVTYERVQFRDGDIIRSVFLRLTSDGARFVSGYEVDRQGEEIVPVGFDRRLRMIAKDTVIRRVAYEMDKTYGELRKGK